MRQLPRTLSRRLAALFSRRPSALDLSAPASPTTPAHRADVLRREDRLSIAVRDLSRDEEACRKIQARGQHLARQDRWDQLTAELAQADTARLRSPGGMPAADLLAWGARADILHAAETALSHRALPGDPRVSAGVSELEDILDDAGHPPYLAAIVALTHIDLGWAWRGDSWDCFVPQSHRDVSARHFARATELLDPLEHLALKSPLIAAARCAVAAGAPRPGRRIADDYAALIDLDAHNHRHMRALGNHMLPRWFGSLDALELEARRTAARTQAIWGAGGYAWVCFDAIAADEQACARLDVAFFLDGLRDILNASPDQETVNLLAAYCLITLQLGTGLIEEADLVRLRIAEFGRRVVRQHLTEIHPLIWAHAAEGFDNNTRITSPARFAERGRADALRLIAETFRDEIDRGRRIVFTAAGAQLLKA